MRLQQEDLAATSRLNRPSKDAQIREAAQEFESMFMAQMLQHMFAGIENNPLFGDKHADKIYQSMMIEEYGKMIAASGGIGVADHVARELLHMQDVSSMPKGE
ncbi:MAG: chemotaxis protein [Sphaerospermopsis sp. SIO1G2]|nr:chemotaxis protein [Sphaerospermopsis sp. SIO1G2]